jgi:hypothetical protein
MTDIGTASDVPGRTMVMGNLLVLCGDTPTLVEAGPENYTCVHHPQPHTQTIYITWYTPNAFTMDASGHGTYSMLVERQPGSKDSLTVYVSTAQLQKAQPNPNSNTPDLTVRGNDDASRAAYFAQLIKGAKKLYSGPLDQNRAMTVQF